MSLEDCSAMYGALVGPGMVVLALALQRVGKAVKMVVAATGLAPGRTSFLPIMNAGHAPVAHA